jgi:16S rRNA (cytosine1402-N4)-methyltransferase
LTGPFYHEPVLLSETLDLLVHEQGGLYLDATLGLGGHSEAILKKLSPEGRLLGLDLDPASLSAARERLKGETARFRSEHANFRTIPTVLEREKFFPLAGALFDLGVSSMHFDDAKRGFSFSKEGPLDMRLSPDNPLTAAAIVNRWPVEQMTLLFREFGEEPQALRIAQAIAARREKGLFETTTQLAAMIEEIVKRTSGTHPATRVFQALRIAVNAELENLTRALEGLLPFLDQGGRIAVISFHSLEDRIVKNIFASFVAQKTCKPVGKAPIAPSKREVAENPRSRSAKLRVVEKL